MKLTLQKRLAASVLGCSEKRVAFDPARLEDIKEAITKTDIRLLIGEGAIREKPVKGVSRVRANKRKTQKSKGLRKGEGSRKGKVTARASKKEKWIKKMRAQRKFLKQLKLKGLLKPDAFKELYAKSKGGFFRSTKHIKLYIQEKNLLNSESRVKQSSAEQKEGKRTKKPPKTKNNPGKNQEKQNIKHKFRLKKAGS